MFTLKSKENEIAKNKLYKTSTLTGTKFLKEPNLKKTPRFRCP